MLILVWVCCLIGALQPFQHRGEMRAADLLEMRSRQRDISKLNLDAQRSLRCEVCDGTGRIVKKKKVLLPGGFSRIDDVPQRCPNCNGVRIKPWGDCAEKLSAFYYALRRFDRDYPFKAPLKTSFEMSVFRGITTDKAVWNVNKHTLPRLRGPYKAGDVFLIGLQFLDYELVADGGRIYEVKVLQAKGHSQPFHIHVYVPKAKRPIGNGAFVLALAWREGVATYQGLAKNGKTSNLLTLLALKPMVL